MNSPFKEQPDGREEGLADGSAGRGAGEPHHRHRKSQKKDYYVIEHKLLIDRREATSTDYFVHPS